MYCQNGLRFSFSVSLLSGHFQQPSQLCCKIILRIRGCKVPEHCEELISTASALGMVEVHQCKKWINWITATCGRGSPTLPTAVLDTRRAAAALCPRYLWRL